MRVIGAGFAVAVLLFFMWAMPARAQVAWEAPLLVSPGTPAGWGVFLVDPSPGSGIGALGTWRDGGPLGFRIGIAEGFRGDLAIYGGVDVSGSLLRHSADFPLDIDWVTGVGLGIGDRALVTFPLGLSLGRTLQADGVTFNPYVAPRILLDAWFGGERGPSGTDLNLAVDVGVDLAFSPAWAIRFGGTFGDRNAVAVGLSFR